MPHQRQHRYGQKVSSKAMCVARECSRCQNWRTEIMKVKSAMLIHRHSCRWLWTIFLMTPVSLSGSLLLTAAADVRAVGAGRPGFGDIHFALIPDPDHAKSDFSFGQITDLHVGSPRGGVYDGTVHAFVASAAKPREVPKAKPLLLCVAPNGNDAWSGQLAAPNTAKTDGPLATIRQARDQLRKLKAAGGLKQPVRVQVYGGTYRVSEPVVFTAEDSGSETAPITYAAAPASSRSSVAAWPSLGGRRRRSGRPGQRPCRGSRKASGTFAASSSTAAGRYRARPTKARSTRWPVRWKP